MEYTLAEAAKATGIGKTTIFRAIKSGKLSARRLDDRTFRVDASELARIYPMKPLDQMERAPRNDLKHSATAGEQSGIAGTVRNQGGDTAGTGIELAELRVEVRMLREALDRERQDKRDMLDDLRRRLDAEQEERRALQRQLTAPPPPAPAAPERAQEDPAVAPVVVVDPPKVPKGFLGRLMGLGR